MHVDCDASYWQSIKLILVKTYPAQQRGATSHVICITAVEEMNFAQSKLDGWFNSISIGLNSKPCQVLGYSDSCTLVLTERGVKSPNGETQ